MNVLKKAEKTKNLDPEKCGKMLKELIEVFQKYGPTVGETIITYGNLGYSLGASIGGYAGKGPDLDKLKELFYTNPTIDVAMMLEGLTVTSWYESYIEQKAKEQK